MTDLATWLDRLPLIAILRGIAPEQAVAVGEALVEAGFGLIEVPLNSPAPLDSIRLMSEALATRAAVGAGTVLSVTEVDAVADAGGRLIVSPNADRDVVARTKARGLIAAPGVMTPSEAFAMIAAGADALKLFPAEAIPPRVVKGLRAVLPPQMPLLPVGSITPETMAGYWQAGARGFGLGSAISKPGSTAEVVGARAREFVSAFESLKTGRSEA